MATKVGKQENNVGTTSKKKYVVTRSGVRVSEKDYDSIESASDEVEHWKKIISRWPDGTKIVVEEYNEKKHKVY
jgi:hypothetical protein